MRTGWTTARVAGTIVATLVAVTSMWFPLVMTSWGTMGWTDGTWRVIFWICAAGAWVGVAGWWRGNHRVAAVGAWLAVVPHVPLSALVLVPMGFAVWTTLYALPPKQTGTISPPPGP